MASLKCSNCGYGIHYHGISNGTEYILFDLNFWNWIITQKFDKNKKTYDKSGYPFLYRSDSIQTEFVDKVYHFWKCKKCGTLAFFKPECNMVDSVYTPDESYKPNYNSKKIGRFICFDDHLWDEITEKALPVNEIMVKYVPAMYVLFFEDGILCCQDFDGEYPIMRYKKGVISDFI